MIPDLRTWLACLDCGCPVGHLTLQRVPEWTCPNCGQGFVKMMWEEARP